MTTLNETASGERIHIALFGNRNVGKSSVINALTGQTVSLTSHVPGTTTDPVRKAMELLPLGPVVLIDTPGMDDTGTLGELRVKRAREILSETDLALIITDVINKTDDRVRSLVALCQEQDIPYLIVYNKADLEDTDPASDHILSGNQDPSIWVSAKTGYHIRELKEMLGRMCPRSAKPRPLVSDLVSPGDLALLVTPIDSSAPKGRLILPQQQTLRELLNAHAIPLCCQVQEVSDVMSGLGDKIRLVITDSQAFEKVAQMVPNEVPMTSFSILFARYKGDLPQLMEGAQRLKRLKSGDKVLICEGCTHHRQCGDIGTEKLPRWIRSFCGSSPVFHFTSGKDFPAPEALSDYALLLHCGGCMLTETEMRRRMKLAKDSGIPMINYGVAIACIHGILERATKIFENNFY